MLMTASPVRYATGAGGSALWHHSIIRYLKLIPGAPTVDFAKKKRPGANKDLHRHVTAVVRSARHRRRRRRCHHTRVDKDTSIPEDDEHSRSIDIQLKVCRLCVLCGAAQRCRTLLTTSV